MEKLLKRIKDLDPEERQRIQQQLKESKDGDVKGEMGWMYKGDRPDTEEYLLGRKVDRHIEEPEQESAASEESSFAEIIKRRADIDMHAKMREDPLYQIKKREEESRKRLLENPIKMKQLQKMLEEKQGSKKKKKKKEKKKKRSKSSSDSSEDSDDELLEKYLSIVKGKNSKGGKTKPSPERSSSSTEQTYTDSRHRHKHISEPESRRHSDSKNRDKNISYHESRHSKKSDSSSHRSSHSKSQSHRLSYSKSQSKGDVSLSRQYSKSERSVRQDSSDSDSDKRRKGESSHHVGYESDDGERPAVKAYGLIGGRKRNRDRSRSPKHRQRARSRSPVVSKPRVKSPPRRKLTKEEMDRKRRDMMENAKCRDEQREKNVKTYKAQADREEQMIEKMHSKGTSSDFINPMMTKHVDESSVQDRIKRNIYKVQRTSASLDKKFTQK